MTCRRGLSLGLLSTLHYSSVVTLSLSFLFLHFAALWLSDELRMLEPTGGLNELDSVSDAASWKNITCLHRVVLRRQCHRNLFCFASGPWIHAVLLPLVATPPRNWTHNFTSSSVTSRLWEFKCAPLQTTPELGRKSICWSSLRRRMTYYCSRNLCRWHGN